MASRTRFVVGPNKQGIILVVALAMLVVPVMYLEAHRLDLGALGVLAIFAAVAVYLGSRRLILEGDDLVSRYFWMNEWRVHGHAARFAKVRDDPWDEMVVYLDYEEVGRLRPVLYDRARLTRLFDMLAAKQG